MHPAALAAITTIIGTLCYASACFLSPFGRCRKCRGRRRILNRLGRGSRDCRRCDGTGLRLRLGRHLWNYARRLHDGR
ncbi:hypothetical protein C1J01_22755 [Nonomuraea aridisoli]|uniref:Uncharacterized protein n=1 Tax=Nonomuraea aridisoli TaxID=2070368 RepID=A0A2W2EQK2_9ACTN|nr:hypothetical protein C1J01_22755 [Nonomuraea aridisoli]